MLNYTTIRWNPYREAVLNHTTIRTNPYRPRGVNYAQEAWYTKRNGYLTHVARGVPYKYRQKDSGNHFYPGCHNPNEKEE